MDAINAGSNPLAFVILALDSAKAIHQSLSTIKDAPRIVSELLHDIHLLQSVLQRLSNCSLSHASDSTVSSLQDMLRTCTTELTSIEAQLARFSTKPTSGRSNRVYKGILAVIKKEDLEDARNRVRDKTAQANLYLGLFQTQAITDASLKIDTQASTTTGILGQILAEVARLNTRLDRNNVASNLTSDSMGDEKNTDTSAGTILEDLEAMTICSELEQSILRLSGLVDRDALSLDADDAEQIIEDLQRIIQTARDKVSINKKCHKKAPTYSNIDEEDNVLVRRDLKLIEGLMLSAPIVSINKPALNSKQFLASLPRDAAIKQKRIREEIAINHGCLTISTNKRRRICRTSMADSLGNLATHRDVIANITFRPSGSSCIFSVSVSQGQLFDRSIQSIPRISVCPIIPNNSLVFRLVREGQLGEFQALLNQRKASIRDHDEDGMSLLHYAATGSIEICKFLLESGVDVDEMGSHGGTALSSTTGLGRHDTVQVLLENMADPTLSYPGWDNPLATACNSDIPSVELFFKYGSHFAMQDLETPDMNGRTRLHQLCMAASKSTSKRKAVSVLVSAGAQLTARIGQSWSPDDHETLGFTCLHSLVYTANRTTDRDEFETLVFLIQNGADPLAIDHHENTVSMRAYLPNENDNHYSSKGSYRGDLWDAALAACGFDLGEFRALYPRMPRYNRNYTRKDFERLWQGNEPSCPYWDDKRYPEIGGTDDYWKYSSQFSYQVSCSKCDANGLGRVSPDPEPHDDDLPPYAQNGYPRMPSPDEPESTYAEALGSQEIMEQHTREDSLVLEAEGFHDRSHYDANNELYIHNLDDCNDGIYDYYYDGFDDEAAAGISPPRSEEGDVAYERLTSCREHGQDAEAFSDYLKERHYLDAQLAHAAYEIRMGLSDDDDL